MSMYYLYYYKKINQVIFSVFKKKKMPEVLVGNSLAGSAQ